MKEPSSLHHDKRAKHIGASEIASLFYAWAAPSGAILYLHMWESPPDGAECLGCVGRHETGYRLYHEKAGNLEPEQIDCERVDAGTFLEPALAQWAQHKWDWTLRKVRRYCTGPIPGMGASLDYETATGERVPVEFKNVDFLVFRETWQADRDEIQVPPMDITLQLQHQIACSDSASHGWIVACVAGNELKRGRIDAHEPTIERIQAAVHAFWRAIEDEDAPNHLADYDSVAELYASGGKEGIEDMSMDNEAPFLARRLKRWSTHRKRVENHEGQLKARLGAKLGKATKGKLADGTVVSWPVVNRKESTRTIPAATYRGGMTIKEAS